jgi:uridylate kinase
MGQYTDIVRQIKAEGHEVAVILGGGALARQFIGLAKELGLDVDAQDEVAISCSRLLRSFSLSD